LFVLTVENGTIECGLELGDGGLGNVVGDLLGVF
jgi:hypothetical protein